MTKKFIFLIFMCLFGGLSSHLMAQEVITIGSGTSANVYAPVYDKYNYSVSQSLYSESLLGNLPANATIKSISFFVNYGETTTRNVSVYLKDANGATENTKQSYTDDDKVFEGNATINKGGLVTFTFTKDYVYSGKGFFIYVNDHTGTNLGNKYHDFKASTSTKGTLRGYSNNAELDENNLTSSTNLLSNIQITYVEGSTPEPTPPTVTLTSPANEATDIFNPTLNFTLKDATQYMIQMAEGIGEFSTLQDWTDGNGSISYQTNLLKSNTTYSWKVIAKNDNGETTSDVYSFTTKEFGVPGAITNVSPEDNAQDLINPVLSWTFGANTEQQQVLIDGNIVVDWTNIGTKTNDSYQTSNLAAGAHTWQVNTKNGAGETTGKTYTFTVASLPDNVTAISPTNGETNVSSNKIKWQFAENTTEYRLLVHYGEDTWGWDNGWVYELGNNNTWIPTNGAEEMEFELKSFETSKTYYWAVDVKNSIGIRTVYQGGEEITKFSFTTASTLPVSNTAPANGATNLENPELQWNYVGNAQQYKVYLGKDENNLTAVTEEWTARESVETGLAGSGSYQTSGLDGATKYFWRVDVKDENENVIAGEVWSFVTTLPVPTNVEADPQNVVASMSGFGSTKIKWTAIENVEGYNIYLDGEKLNGELITTNEYTIEAKSLKLEYNIDPGYNITVSAVYDLGESVVSEAVNVKVTGCNNFSIIVKNYTNNPIEGATITITGADELGEERLYEFTTDENGSYTTIPKEDDDEVNPEEEPEPLVAGTYTMTIKKDNYDEYVKEITITKDNAYNETITLNSEYVFNVYFEEGYVNTIKLCLYSDKNVPAANYNIYVEGKNEPIVTMVWFGKLFDEDYEVQYTLDWSTFKNGEYKFGVERYDKPGIINWATEKAVRNYNIFEKDGNITEADNWRDGLPEAGEEIYINAAAELAKNTSSEYGHITINGSLTLNNGSGMTADNISINNAGQLTIGSNASLTANNIFAYNAEGEVDESKVKVTLNDGAQLRQNNANLKAKFVMDITNPTNWNAEGNTDGWQFIASPFTNANISDFTNVTGGYDLFKFDGTQEKEWVNQNKTNDGGDEDGDDDGGVGGIERPEENSGSRSGEETFETQFVNGRGYLASYESATTATLSGTVNNATTHTYTVAYDAENKWANFHLLGNPFTFNMDWNNVQKSSLADGFVTIDPVNGYVYNASGTIAAGDGFFVKAIGADPTISYLEGTRGYKESSNSINLIATGNAGSDNVIINLNEEKEGFNKLDNFNKNIASIFVSKENKRYGIASYDKDITEIAVCFDAKQMGSYTIAAKPNGEFETLVLVDRFTGIETNLLEESYSFTATSNDSYDRFIVKMVNGQQTTDNSHFAYVSGEELILNIEGSVQIIDVMGRIVYTNDVIGDNNRINVSAFDNAAYVVRVINENGVKVQKIIL